MHEILKGLLSRHEREMIEKDKYNRSEYGGEYRDEYYYGNDFVDNIYKEGRIYDDIFCITDDRGKCKRSDEE